MTDKADNQNLNYGGKNRKLTRYELDAQAREENVSVNIKACRQAHADPAEQKKAVVKEVKDPRIGSRKKVPLMVEFVNQPEKGGRLRLCRLSQSNQRFHRNKSWSS